MRTSTWLAICLVVGVVGIGLAGYRAHDLVESRRALIGDAKQAARQEARAAADEIDQILRRCAAAVDSLAEDLGTETHAGKGFDDRLKTIVENEPEILTAGIAFDPSVFGRLHAPAITRRDKTIQTLQLEDHQDYSAPGVAWYHDGIREGKGWRTPAWSETEESMTVTYSAPLSRSAEEPSTAVGVAFISLSLDRINERMDELETGHLGWGGILSQEGRYLVHPNEQRLEDPATLMDTLKARGDDELLDAVNKALGGESVSLERTDEMTGQTAWFFHEPVKETGWSVVVARFEDEVLVTGRAYRRSVILIAVISIVGLISIAGSILGNLYSRQPRPGFLWALVAFTAIVMLAGMEIIRLVAYDQVSDEDREAVKILNEDSLSSFVRSQSALWVRRHEARPVTIPTGILVRTLAFREAKEILVSGVVWQKFTDKLQGEIPRGVDFPDAIQLEVTEAYRRRHDEVETVGWRFEATLRQIMDQSRYPLDHDNVSIRLLPNNYDSRVILVPDLVSYTLINPNAKPGLEEALELSSWSIVGSFFDYKYSSYNTDLGIPDYEGEESLPELHFNIELKRNVLNAVIANGIPMGIVLLMLFAIIVKRTDDTEESKLFGFNPSGVMRICSALFFVVLLAHIQMRNSLQVKEIVFLEYHYFIVYLAILFTALHTFLFFSKYDIPIVKYKESLFTKLIFWPAILGLQLVIAILVLY